MSDNGRQPEWYYIVQQIDTGVIVYRGTSLMLAADNLKPGTCYGKGTTAGEATIHLIRWRNFFRKQKERSDAVGIGCEQSSGSE
jgi:hypothetical protein